MPRDLVRQLKMLKQERVNPRGDLEQKNRALLLSQIRNTVAVNSNDETARGIPWQDAWSTLSIVLPRRFVYNVLRPATVLLIILSIATSGWIATVDAAYEALPGDWLYPAKRAAEKTRLTVAAVVGDKKTETKLHSEFAGRRAREVKKILAGDDARKEQRATKAIAELKEDIKTVNSEFVEDAKKDGTASLSAEVAKNLKKDVEQISNVLQEVKDNLQAGVGGENTSMALSKEVSEAKDLMKDTAVKAVETMVVKHLEGDQSVSKDDVKEAISASLQTVMTDAAESKQNMEGARVVEEAAKSEMKDLMKEAVGQNQAIVTSTKELSAKITEAADKAKEAVAKTSAASEETGKKVSEAKELLVSGDLVKAVDKMKEATAVSKEAEKIRDSAIEEVQAVVPIVGVADSALLSIPTSTTQIIKAMSSTTAPAISAPPALGVKTTTTAALEIKTEIKKK